MSVLARVESLIRQQLAPPELSLWEEYGWLITTSLAMILAWAFNVPNAGVFLVSAVVYSALVGGVRPGLTSAGLASLYSAIFLSLPDRLFHYTGSDARALSGIAVVCFGCVALVARAQAHSEAANAGDSEDDRRRRAGEESEARFRKLADDVPTLMWMGDERGNRYFFNSRWLQMTGKPLEEQVDGGWKALIHPLDRAEALNRYVRAVRSLERFEAEYRIRAGDGEYRWIQDTGVPTEGASGGPQTYLGCCVDRTERKRVEHALHQLSGRLLELQDDERRRIARELHDTTAQNLAVLLMNLSVVKEATKVLSQRARQAVAESVALAERSSQEIRTLSYLLHPPLLDELGLTSALRSYTTGFTNRTGIQVELKMSDVGRLPRDLELTMFRIAQEALTNVHRHSGSTRAEVRVIRDPKEVKLMVGDEGRGVPPEALDIISIGASVGVGIQGMRERAIQLGGQLKVASSSAGTTVTAILPMREET